MVMTEFTSEPVHLGSDGFKGVQMQTRALAPVGGVWWIFVVSKHSDESFQGGAVSFGAETETKVCPLSHLTGSEMQRCILRCHICCQKKLRKDQNNNSLLAKVGCSFRNVANGADQPSEGIRGAIPHTPNEPGVKRETFFLGVVPHICLSLLCLSGHSCVGASAGVGKVATGVATFRPCGCGGEGSWHRDLMHKDKQKSHCQGFPPFHSSAGEHPRFPQWDDFISSPLLFFEFL